MRVIIAGSRGFSNYELLKTKMDKILERQTDVIIVSGGARGADKLGERYAKERGYALEVFPADWNKYGKAAGYRRNEQMAEAAKACVCFWDGVSPGTKHMIDLCMNLKLRLKLRVVRI